MIDLSNRLFTDINGKKFYADEYISATKIQERIKEVANEINKDYEGKEVRLICILRGAVMFLSDLMKNLTLDHVTIDFMSVSSYGDEKVSSGLVRITKDLDSPIEDKNVLIVEDILDTGHTLEHLMKMFESRNPQSVKICVLLDKKERREVPLNPDYVCFEIEDKFVLGYGLDYEQELRNLPFVATARFI
ncbi:MAG: hypoxanthine phosphoribosyltransferase [Eubacteriales bacterium]|nr:hypoxanthine phosphoribosyltransferase [Eubacteriales bacterium]